MFRISAFAALAAVAFLVTGPDVADARCGNGRSGILSRITHPFRTISANHQARVSARQSYVPAPMPSVIPQPLPKGPEVPADPMDPKNAATPRKAAVTFQTVFVPAGYLPPPAPAGMTWKKFNCNRSGCTYHTVPLAPTPPQPKTSEQFDVADDYTQRFVVVEEPNGEKNVVGVTMSNAEARRFDTLRKSLNPVAPKVAAVSPCGGCDCGPLCECINCSCGIKRKSSK